jgi:hypothetical protein
MFLGVMPLKRSKRANYGWHLDQEPTDLDTLAMLRQLMKTRRHTPQSMGSAREEALEEYPDNHISTTPLAHVPTS